MIGQLRSLLGMRATVSDGITPTKGFVNYFNRAAPVGGICAGTMRNGPGTHPPRKPLPGRQGSPCIPSLRTPLERVFLRRAKHGSTPKWLMAVELLLPRGRVRRRIYQPFKVDNHIVSGSQAHP